jgi:hypothetical protein
MKLENLVLTLIVVYLLTIAVLGSYTLLFASKQIDKNNGWIDITHTLDCKDFAYVGKDGECYLGPNDEIMSKFKYLEKDAYPWYLDNDDNNPYKVGRSLGSPKK